MNGEFVPDSCDVLVAGSGAAGLVAAIAAAISGADVVLVESAETLGGTTGLSGGRVWIPAHGRGANANDTVEAGRQYLTQLFDTAHPEMIDAFLGTGRDAIEFIERTTPHRFVDCPRYPDYHPDLPGATVGGRCLDAEPVDVRQLHPLADRTVIPDGYTPITHAEWEQWRYPKAFDHGLIAERLKKHIRTGGVGLVASLVHGAVHAGVRIVNSTRLIDLRTDGGRVTGAVLDADGSTSTVGASAVILATGGFDGNSRLRSAHLPAGLHLSNSATTNTGIALTIADKVGARTANLDEGWWMPAVLTTPASPGLPPGRGLIRERGAPHQILVNAAGARFTDEAQPYNEFGKAMHRLAPDGSTPNSPAVLVFDEVFRRNYPLPGLPPKGPVPETFVVSDSIEDLAVQSGVDPAGLIATVHRWNALCANGVDTDYGRGSNAYDRYYGDPNLPGAPNLGPIVEPPFYATRLYASTIGTKGGPVTTPDGAVVHENGSVIPGLFAVGNAAAFWTADGYPGPGATLAVGIVFGYRAGCAAAVPPTAAATSTTRS